MSAKLRGQLLVGLSAIAALALVGSYLAAGGGSYSPAQVKDPCEERTWREPEGLEELAEQFTFSALDGAACELGVSRETLAQALATTTAREQFLETHDISEEELARAARSGLLRAVDDAESAGALSPLIAGPLRATIRNVPLDRTIELVENVREILDGAQSFFAPAQDLFEQFLR